MSNVAREYQAGIPLNIAVSQAVPCLVVYHSISPSATVMPANWGSRMSEQPRTIHPTGISNCDTAGRVGGIYVLGILHKSPLTIARLTGAITHYEPDVVAVEASAEAVIQYHPDELDSRWPPRDEVEAAAFATDRLYDLWLAGIDTQEYESTTDFEQLDREIFTELGVIDSEAQLRRSTYHDLDLSTIRQWRERTRQRAPEAFQSVLQDRDEVMAGHLYALANHERFNSIVAVVGVQHLTGVLDLLSCPSDIPNECIENPPILHYRLFPRDSPHSSA